MVNCAMTNSRRGYEGEQVGLRVAGIAVAVALASAMPWSPAHSASVNAQARAKVVKPLTIQSVQDLDLGVVMLGSGAWSGATVRLSRSGVLTCSATIACSGATQVAQYNVSGTNNQTVTISAPNVTLVNQQDSAKTLTLVVDSPGTVLISNSGSKGVTFPLGGAITVNSTTAAGAYVGTFNVTADYQ